MADKPTYNDNVGLPDIHYNPLQNYRNVTYNTRLTMMPAGESAKTRDNRSYDFKRGIVIWETGGAGSIYLEELIMEYAGAGNNTGHYINQLPVSMKGKLVEPVGGRLIEAMSLAAFDLGYKTTADAVYMLEISFTGFDTSTDLPVTCKGWDDEELTFKWYVNLTKLDMMLDFKGSTYDFDLVATGGLSLTPDFMTLEQGFRMIGSPETIGSFCKELEKALNEREEDKVKAGIRCVPHKYVISAHKDITNIKLSSGFWSRQTWSWLIGRGEMQAQPGQTIQTFILGALANSKDLMKFLHRIPEKKDYNNPDTKPNTTHIVPRNLVIIPGAKNVEESEVYSFDDKLGAAAKEVHLFITTKEDPRNIISPQEYKDAQDPANRDKRVENWVKKGLLRKVYKWIYTGENAEVIGTNIKLDNMWRNVRPLWINNETGKAVAPMQTIATAKEKSPADKTKAIACNDAKTINNRINRNSATYAEDAEYDAKTNSIAPKKGWYPHMPQFYHMNVGINQNTQQGALSEENAHEYSIYKQIGANLSGSGEMVKLGLDVVGDPYYLMQIPGKAGTPPWEEDVWEYEKNQLTDDMMAEKRKKAGTHTWLPFIYFEAQVPAVSVDAQDRIELRRSDAISGVYYTVKVTNKFVKGKFTTHLECGREALSNPWTGKMSQSAKDGTPASTPGTASNTGPNNPNVAGAKK
jgi:hypothetical protein